MAVLGLGLGGRRGAGADAAAVGIQRALILVSSQKTLPVRASPCSVACSQAPLCQIAQSGSQVHSTEAASVILWSFAVHHNKFGRIKSETAADRTSSCTSEMQVAVAVLALLAAAGVAPGPSHTSNAHELFAMMQSLIRDCIICRLAGCHHGAGAAGGRGRGAKFQRGTGVSTSSNVFCRSR